MARKIAQVERADAVLQIPDVGVVRHFGILDIGDAGLVSGWSTPEEAQTWNNGHEAVLECKLPYLNEGCRVEVAGMPFFCEGTSHQDVYLYINGFRIGFWRLDSSGKHTLSAKVEAEQIFHRQDHSVLKCAWFFPGAVRPADRGLGADIRQLAFCFNSFTVLAVNESADK